MQKLITAICFIFIVNPISYASDILEFNVVGSIIATTCNIKTPTQTINLGSWQTQSTSGIGSGVGSKSDMVGYTLDFDCPQGLKIDVQLDGNQDSASNIYYIGLEKSDNSTSGVAIEMHYYASNKWQSVVYGSTRTFIASTVEGINSVPLRSFYIQTGSTITSGLANSSVTLNISYQ